MLRVWVRVRLALGLALGLLAALAAGEETAGAEGHRRLDDGSEEEMPETLKEIEGWRLALTSIMAMGFGAFAAGAGIGGGGLLVPTYAFVLGVGAKNAVPLSKATILGVALGNFFMIGFERHPDPAADRPLIDYDLSAYMQSAILLGTVFGVLFNTILPEIAIIVLLMLVLFYNSWRTVRKGNRLRKKEDEAREREEMEGRSAGKEGTVEVQGGSDEEDVLLDEDVDNVMIQLRPSHSDKSFSTHESFAPHESDAEELNRIRAASDDDDDDDDDDEEDSIKGREGPGRLERSVSVDLAKILSEDARQFPPFPLVILSLSLTFIVFYSLVKNDIIGDIGKCTAGWWVWYLTPLPFYGVVCASYAYFYLYAKYEARERVGFPFVDGAPIRTRPPTLATKP
mmetsp:Transcript_15678/g.47748  ORF Transcript_15678/g.47748 Transcript_15678/m.47748 type:complete len:398 (-) Transcript_15678:591-1784(-)